MRPVTSFLSIPVLLSTVVNANSLYCDHIRAQGKSFNLEKLGGPHFVRVSDDKSDPPKITNTTWTVDICEPIKKVKTIPNNQQCPTGTNVCGIVEIWNPETDPEKEKVLPDVISVAGTLADSGSALEPSYLLLNKTDDTPGGLRIEMHGGKHGNRKQKAIIDFLCEKDATGNERRSSKNTMSKRADDDDAKESTSLSFVSYKADEDDKLDVLRMHWKTKYACEEFEEDDDDTTGSKGSWGFFTWFILLLFMGVAAYLIFGSWLNYNRYGARGWDLLPHGDTIRDVPYIFKDFSRKVVDTFSGGGSRGGYSAV